MKASMQESKAMNRSRRPARGFTLIELLIAVAIVGILAAIAVPSYSAWVTKTRRTDATIFLVEAAGEQVRFQSENNRYATTMEELGYGAGTIGTEEGHYSVAVAAGAGATSFELVATPVPGGPQAGDAECGSFRISATGARTTSTGSADCW